MKTRKCFLIAALHLLAISLACVSPSVTGRNVATNSARASSSDENQEQKKTDSTQTGLVSLIQVIANPKEFHGKQIQVIGFAHFEFEGNGIYLNREDYQYGLYKNGLWLSMPKTDKTNLDKYREMNNSYAIVEGTFNAEFKGHMGVFNGSIENITKLQRWAKAKPAKDNR
jgi:hypothetical protein